MIPGETKLAEFKTKTFQFPKRLYTCVNMFLLFETLISLMGDKHHGHPVIAGVARNLFRAIATFHIHNFVFLLLRLLRADLYGLLRATKRCYVVNGKKDDFSSAGLTLKFQTTQYSSHYNKLKNRESWLVKVKNLSLQDL